jgi:hypothetical protein
MFDNHKKEEVEDEENSLSSVDSSVFTRPKTTRVGQVRNKKKKKKRRRNYFFKRMKSKEIALESKVEKVPAVKPTEMKFSISINVSERVLFVK